MHTQKLTHIIVGPGPDDVVPIASHNIDVASFAREEALLQESVLNLCPANLWHNGSYASGCPRPVLVGEHHQQQMKDLHKALTAAIADIVQRWWSDTDARFPERMPLEPREEELLKWIETQVKIGNLAPFPQRLGSWRPDFLVEETAKCQENYCITEINARFSFNGFMHEAYGQEAINRNVRGEETGLIGATEPEMILQGLFSLFDPNYPLHLLKGDEKGIDIHMFIDAVERRFGIKPRLVTPDKLRLLPDVRSKTGYRLCCVVKGIDEPAVNSWRFKAKNGEVWDEIHQVGLELHQRELDALDLDVLRQISLRCFNDMRTVLLVHDKRMLGIIRQELPRLTARGVLTETQAEALESNIVDTILPGSTELDTLIQAGPQSRQGYILKPIRSGKGDGIIFGDDLTGDEWTARLEGLSSANIVPGVSAAVAVSLLSCSHALRSAFRQSRNGKARDQFYQDDDGCASPRSLAEFTNRGAKSFIVVFSAIGAATCIVNLVITTLYHDGVESVIEPALILAAWALLRQAAQRDDLDKEDVPQADSRLRSQDLKKRWDQLTRHESLFHSIVAMYKGRLVILWAVTLVRCAVSILPFWFMLKIINILEGGTARADNMQLMIFVLLMALSNLLDSWMEGWAYWYSLESLALPIRSQISGIIFGKVLLRKNIRTSGGDESVSETDDEEDTPSLKSHQAIVNLVGIDTERLSYFFQYHFLIIAGVVKLIVFSIFLLRILGWLPLIAGIMAWALTLPLNTWFSGKVLTESRALMRHRDMKLSKISEVLTGLRQIKFSALERQWERRILKLRNAELATLWNFFLADSGLFACWVISPILLAVASLTTYVLVHGTLLPSVAFVSIGIFNNLETTLGSLPELLTLGLDSLVSLKRISAYLDEPENETELTLSDTISFHNASIAWPTNRTLEEGDFVLSELRLFFPNHALSVVSGKVGTGKTLLLSAILGEADLISGEIHVPKKQQFQSSDWIIPGSIAYISQNPWLENCSLRDNILFGLPMDKSRYNQVLEACALSEDLKSLPDGDDTEIGSNGVNLSGGQKWRVTLARAVYSSAEVLLMEDIFSAVDSHVGAWIYDRCLTGDICQGRTRIIVTHHLSLVMPGASFVVELGDGGVIYSGRPKLSVHHQEDASSNDTEDDLTLIDASDDALISPRSETEHAKSDATPKKFMQDEIRQKGNVKRSVYLTYVNGSGGLLPCALCIGIYLAYQAGILGRAWVLRIWTAKSSTSSDTLNTHHISGSSFSTTQLLSHHSKHIAPDPDVIFYLKIYIAISVATAVVADFNIIDERVAMTWSQFFSHLLRLVSICVASCFTSVYLIPPAAVLLAIGAFIGNRYLVASRPLKRLESNAKSPVFELFNTTLAGISTIRAFRRTQTYLEQMHNNLDAWTMTSFYILLANRWMSLRMALITALFSITVGVVIIAKQIDAALAGLALSFILDFSESLRWTIRSYGDMELEMNSMERVVEYMNIETEYLGGLRPAAAWPRSGSVEVKDLEVAYAPDLPPVLKGLSFKIKHGERVGVVGRTGAGKSSMTLALFRFLEARSGSIAIDGVDISKLKLTDLRSKMSIIPQSGSNLSQGQQQLLCIARALLAASKVIVLDEATSAIDIATDTLIQKSIREWFRTGP
ncbi:hypothetical protein FGSG_04440 [Fusarium graminearum PH-1]|uniref:hypothetical protein n=1 Tax=Gibberella zeae (strain ATCC MYA-4620 / CBS 123657 / FGSC 9075 / NRRL 31084 / PH-1) TaxID=229533 RepID=UPI00021F15C7|nr:hypothetical protein FGSG_04440 [Fusarium graminearum PH-1]ESU08663.1 hypothetical protein FGSG_04440 [Fusarium graminearum PH-1]|eukprot:XP_011321162.1 hypothetical protein FGSG_04440 [Fusarium graminearum PH-1]